MSKSPQETPGTRKSKFGKERESYMSTVPWGGARIPYHSVIFVIPSPKIDLSIFSVQMKWGWEDSMIWPKTLGWAVRGSQTQA